MSKIIVTPSSLDHMYELTSYNIDGFIIPIKNLSANQSFEVDYKDLELVIDKIKNKEVIVNYDVMNKNSYILKENDIFSIRRYGKYKFVGIVKSTKKNNFIIRYLKYI